MRVMVFVKATEDSEAGTLPSAELMEAMEITKDNTRMTLVLALTARAHPVSYRPAVESVRIG